jgi:hypothetical protein
MPAPYPSHCADASDEPTDGADGSSDGPARGRGDDVTDEGAPTEAELARRLGARAGGVVTTELDRALRAFDDGSGVPSDARRVLSTMAVRIAVGVVRRPAVAPEDGAHAETLAALFRVGE